MPLQIQAEGGSGIDKEQADIVAAEIMQYSSMLEKTILRLRMIGGCPVEEISYSYDSNDSGTYAYPDDFYNSNSPTDLSCHFYNRLAEGFLYWISSLIG